MRYYGISTKKGGEVLMEYVGVDYHTRYAIATRMNRDGAKLKARIGG